MTLHEGLTRVIEDARDHSRKNFNVVKESYGQYLARAILASDVIAQVRAEALRDAREALIADQIGVYGIVLPDVNDAVDLLNERADRIEKAARIAEDGGLFGSRESGDWIAARIRNQEAGE